MENHGHNALRLFDALRDIFLTEVKQERNY